MWLLSTWFAKLTKWFLGITRKGSGYTLPGHVLLRLFPSLPKLIRYSKGIILITGTNGKTTTASLITYLLNSSGFSVSHNSSGANLLRGILTSALLSTDFFGRNTSDFGVFEVDEFAFPQALEFLDPKVCVLLNLSRDQLDRYGETDIIFSKWVQALKSSKCEIVCDHGQAEFLDLPKELGREVHYFDDSPDLLRKTSLSGGFNAKNINAASVALGILGVVDAKDYLPGFEVAYGRGEVVTKDSISYKILLAKNPASFNNNLELLHEDPDFSEAFLIVLNDKIPDGRDVSWIYDVESVKIAEVLSGRSVYVAGTRALDMAVRLGYAGVDVPKERVFSEVSQAFSFIRRDGASKKVAVLPNYSAMLECRKILVGRDIL